MMLLACHSHSRSYEMRLENFNISLTNMNTILYQERQLEFFAKNSQSQNVCDLRDSNMCSYVCVCVFICIHLYTYELVHNCVLVWIYSFPLETQ